MIFLEQIKKYIEGNVKSNYSKFKVIVEILQEEKTLKKSHFHPQDHKQS